MIDTEKYRRSTKSDMEDLIALIEEVEEAQTPCVWTVHPRFTNQIVNPHDNCRINEHLLREDCPPFCADCGHPIEVKQ